MTTLVPRPVVLVVEDDTVNQKLMADICKTEGYEVVTADDGEGALEVFQHREVHLVLLDATMPRKDGLAVCRQIRAMGDVPVIMVTASMEPGIQHRALEAGATAFVSKPFRIYELTKHIRAALMRPSPSEPPTSLRRAMRRTAAASLLEVPGAVDLRLRLRREADFDGQLRACLMVRVANEREISKHDGRHAIDAVLGAIGQALLGALGEGSVYWSDTAELAAVMGAERLDGAARAAREAVASCEPLQVRRVELQMGAVDYRAAAKLDIDAVLQQARTAAEAATSSGGPIVIRSLGEQAPVSSA